ncbi:MAG TPA: DUF2284 domain-containing protein [Desulfosporosinus sp.]|nr:DUF2284 domain-containing protein [Desulfosporosinus sp.]
MECAGLGNFALEQGAYQAKLVETSVVVIDERVRLKCYVPICEHYDQHLLCPPHTLEVEKFRQLCGQYNKALLVQVKSTGIEQEELLEAEKKLHRILNQVESKAMSEGYYLAAGFIASSCKLCPKCVGYHSKLPCRHPFEARSSIEAMGVDIFKTCEQAGIGFQLGISKEVVFTGLALIG